MGLFKKIGNWFEEKSDDLGDWYRDATPWDTPREKDARAAKNEQDAANKAKEQGQRIDDARRIKEQQLLDMVAARQAVINPNDQLENKFANMTNQFAGMSNQMANLGVATQAAEFQAEEADIALANTLDTMRASGAGAGGATALAQAALQSKRGISADLQQQEAANQKAAAQGAQQLQTMIAQGATDIQRLQAQGADSVQRAKAEGRKFAFSVGEQRQNADIDRAAQQLDNYNKRVADATAARELAQSGNV